MENAKDKALWKKIRTEAKNKFKAYPSAYASFWIVNQYESRGGKYLKNSKKDCSSLTRWAREKWVNICEKTASGKFKSCGRKNLDSKTKSDYPVCRPSVKISKKTPKTVHELSKTEIKKSCETKRKNPKKNLKKF